MIKVIYITSLGHSGSTVLDLLLSKHKDILGLGEVYGPFIGKPENIEETGSVCSCGESLHTCPFWGKYQGRVKDITADDVIAKYRAILDLANKHGKNIIVDSSKKLWMIDYLATLAAKKEIDLKVIFLIRDARGWAVSYARLGKKTGKTKKPHLYYIFRWYLGNSRILKFLHTHNVAYSQISYEQLIFDTEATLKRMLDFARVAQEGFSMANIPNTHIAYGNRMKKTDEVRLVYDSEWMRLFWVNASLILLAPIFFWNRKHVNPSEDKKGQEEIAASAPPPE